MTMAEVACTYLGNCTCPNCIADNPIPKASVGSNSSKTAQVTERTRSANPSPPRPVSLPARATTTMTSSADANHETPSSATSSPPAPTAAELASTQATSPSDLNSTTAASSASANNLLGHKGWLNLQTPGKGCFGRKSWQRRWFVIRGSTLFISTNSDADAHTILPLDAKSEFSQTGAKEISIVVQQKTYECFCESAEDANSWMTALSTATRRAQASKRGGLGKRQALEVTIQRTGEESLGLRIGGGVDSGDDERTQIFITEIQAASLAGKTSKFQKGDIITYVNSIKFDAISLSDATATLRAAAGSIVIGLARKRGSRRLAAGDSKKASAASLPTVPTVSEEKTTTPAKSEGAPAPETAKPAVAAAATAAAGTSSQQAAPSTKPSPVAKEVKEVSAVAVPAAATETAVADVSVEQPKDINELKEAPAAAAAPPPPTAEDEAKKQAARELRRQALSKKRMERQQSAQLELLNALKLIDELPE